MIHLKDGSHLLSQFQHNYYSPFLSKVSHKGDCGRIAILGGSLEYTGAPYFVAMTALKSGADMAHIFCDKQAAAVIKSYSPEFIVHPYLDIEAEEKKHEHDMINNQHAMKDAHLLLDLESSKKASESIVKWLDRMDVVVIGPGLSRHSYMLGVASHVIQESRNRDLPMIIDADALSLIGMNPDLIRGYKKAILTPNVNEMRRLCTSFNRKCEDREGESPSFLVMDLCRYLGHVTLVQKGSHDLICDGNTLYECKEEGSPRRCGGQGDFLAGIMSTFLAWVFKSENKNMDSNMNPCFLAAYTACHLTRQCQREAYKKYGHSMLTTNIMDEIHLVLDRTFGR